MQGVRFLLLGGLMSVVALIGAAMLGGGSFASAESPAVFRVTITNLSDPPTPISPGALVGHCADGAFWSRGQRSSPELELIAEVGDPGAAVAVEREDEYDGTTFVQERYTIGEVGPGQSTSVEVAFAHSCRLSTAHMLVESNDTFVGVNSLDIRQLFTGEFLEVVEVDIRAYDAGTELNTEPGSGFEGGQPDPTRGAENLDNGVATDEPISSSVEWPGTQARLTIELVETLGDADSLEAADSTGSDSTVDEPIGFPNGGSGNLITSQAGERNQRVSPLTILLAIVAGTGLAVGTFRVVRKVRQPR